MNCIVDVADGRNLKKRARELNRNETLVVQFSIIWESRKRKRRMLQCPSIRFALSRCESKKNILRSINDVDGC